MPQSCQNMQSRGGRGYEDDKTWASPLAGKGLGMS